MYAFRIFEHLAWYELCWLLFLGTFISLPGRLLSLSLHPYLVVALFLFWPLYCLKNYKQTFVHSVGCHDTSCLPPTEALTTHPLNFPVMLILLWLPINLWASATRLNSWLIVGYLLWGITLFVVLLRWQLTQQNPQFIAWFFLLCGLGLAIVSPPLVAWKPDFRLFYFPLYDKLTAIPIGVGETIHANVLAGVLVLILPILLVLTWQRLHRIFLIILFLFVIGILILTQSRGGYLAVAAVLPLVVVIRWPRLLYGLVLVIIIIPILLVQQIGMQPLLDQLSADGSLGGWTGRLDIWSNSLLAISDFTFTGIGIGTFTVVMPLLYPLQVSVEGYPHAHNLFLQIGLDLGLPGLIAYLALLINLFVMLISTLRNPHTLPLHRTLAIGATGSLVGMLVHGLLDAVTWGTKLAFMPWILFALITQLFLYTQATQAAHKAAARLENKLSPGK